MTTIKKIIIIIKWRETCVAKSKSSWINVTRQRTLDAFLWLKEMILKNGKRMQEFYQRGKMSRLELLMVDEGLICISLSLVLWSLSVVGFICSQILLISQLLAIGCHRERMVSSGQRDARHPGMVTGCRISSFTIVLTLSIGGWRHRNLTKAMLADIGVERLVAHWRCDRWWSKLLARSGCSSSNRPMRVYKASNVPEWAKRKRPNLVSSLHKHSTCTKRSYGIYIYPTVKYREKQTIVQIVKSNAKSRYLCNDPNEW